MTFNAVYAPGGIFLNPNFAQDYQVNLLDWHEFLLQNLSTIYYVSWLLTELKDTAVNTNPMIFHQFLSILSASGHAITLPWRTPAHSGKNNKIQLPHQ